MSLMMLHFSDPTSLLQKSTRPTNREPAFTLVELLVVIAIIALLMAILLPSLAQARDQGRRVGCLSNHKQILLGLLMYANDYNGTLHEEKKDYYPANGGYTYNGITLPTSGSNPVWVMWYSAPIVGQYIGNTLWKSSGLSGSSNKVIYCTALTNIASKMAKPEWDGTKDSTVIGLNALWNCSLWPKRSAPYPGTPVKVPFGIANPSRFILLADAAVTDNAGLYGDGNLSWSIVTRDRNGVPVDANGNIQQNKYGVNAYRHLGTCVLGFADGHAAPYSDVVSAQKTGEVSSDATK